MPSKDETKNSAVLDYKTRFEKNRSMGPELIRPNKAHPDTQTCIQTPSPISRHLDQYLGSGVIIQIPGHRVQYLVTHTNIQTPWLVPGHLVQYNIWSA